jgi:hypothetical protein
MAITPTIPMVNLGNLYLNGLQLAYASATTMTVAAGQARDMTNTNDIVINQAVTINAAVNGLNGLDSGALVANTFYAVYAVGASTKSDPTAVDPNNPSGFIGVYVAGGLLSLAANAAPTLPSGFDMYRRIGYILTDGSANILDFTQCGDGLTRDMYYAAAIATNITAGASTTFAAVTTTASVPAGAVEVILKAILTADAGGTRTAAFKAALSSSSAGQAFTWAPASTVSTVTVRCPLDSAAQMKYLVSNGSAAIAIDVSGYADAL